MHMIAFRAYLKPETAEDDESFRVVDVHDKTRVCINQCFQFLYSIGIAKVCTSYVPACHACSSAAATSLIVISATADS